MAPAGPGEWERRPWVQSSRPRRWGGTIPEGGVSADKWDKWDSQRAKHEEEWKTVAGPKGEILCHHCGCRKNSKGSMCCKHCGQKL
eukprot:4298296-Pyramimonas_sp.AAC.1